MPRNVRQRKRQACERENSVRLDDPDYKIALVRWQDVSRGWFGYTQTMITNHRTPAVFPKTTWKEISNAGGTN